MANNLQLLTETAVRNEFTALRSDNQALMDALVIASAALKDAGKMHEAALIDEAIYHSTEKKLFREQIWRRLFADSCSMRPAKAPWPASGV